MVEADTPHAAAKRAVIAAFERSGLTKTELGRRLGLKESGARRILDPNHPTKIEHLSEAARVLGGRLEITFAKEAADERPE